ncbi:MAG: hypothetical protein Q8920_04785 [Bacillota bacterium]|nr:hypothetical protein [Bacillota bacterium]
MKNLTFGDMLEFRENTMTLDYIAEKSKASSGGQRDLNFLKYLVDNNILKLTEAVMKRSDVNLTDECLLEHYKKMKYESERHFLCRTAIQEELKKIGIASFEGMGLGNMDILRANSTYDITIEDFSAAIDIGLAPARNYFRGLTDLRLRHYYITPFFDEYMDEVIFNVFTRVDDNTFIGAVKDYVTNSYEAPITGTNTEEFNDLTR